MLTHSRQTGTLAVPGRAHSVRSGVMAGGLMISVVVASLLLVFVWNLNGARYPGADRQSTALFRLTYQYQTPDDLPKVLRWYAQHFGLSHEMPQGENCVMMTGEDTYLFLQQSLAVTLCAHQRSTLIFVDRTFAVP